MSRTKKIICAMLSVIMVLGLSLTPAFAFGGDVALRRLAYTINGIEMNGIPENGDTINVKATFDNQSGSSVTRTIILAAYDEESVLRQIAISDVNVDSNTTTVSGDTGIVYQPGIYSIKAMIWERGENAIPVYTRKFVGNINDELVSSVSVNINGTQREGIVNPETKELVVGVPMYDQAGAAVALQAYDITVNTKKDIAGIADIDDKFSGSGKVFTKNIDLASGGRNIFITETEGSRPEIYKLVVDRVIEENFDTGFSGEFKGDEISANQSTAAYEGTWRVSGSERAKWFAASAKWNGKYDPDKTYLGAMSIKTVASSEVKMIDDISKTLPVGTTEVSGNVLMVNKPSNGNTDTSASDYGSIALRVGTATKFAEAQNATHFIVEYDSAYEIRHNDSENAGREGALTAGVHVFGGGSNMTGSGKTLARLSGINGAITSSSRFNYQAGKESVGLAKTATEDMSQWRHVKVEITRPSADSSDMTVKTYYDDVLQDVVYKSIDPEESNEQGALSPNWVWPDQVAMQSATARSCQMYFDNLKISYDIPGDYSDKPSRITGITVNDKYSGTVKGDVAFLEIPLYDEAGRIVEIDPSWITKVSTIDANDTVQVGNTVLSGDTVKTGVIDYSNGGYNITVNDEAYKLIVYRVYEESFDGNYITAGEKTYNGSEWSGAAALSGDVASIWNWSQSANSGDNATYGFSALGKTSWDYLKGGFFPYADAKAQGSTTEALAIAQGGAAPSGNALGVIKSMAFQGKDSSMISAMLGKNNVADGGMPGLDVATDFTLEYDIAYDYNMEADFSVGSTNYPVYRAPLTAGAIIRGYKNGGGYCDVLRQTTSENTDSAKSTISVGNYLPNNGENNSSTSGVEGYFRSLDSLYTADKWHRIKTQITRDTIEADSSNNLYQINTKVSVDGNAPKYNATYYAGWPSRIQFRTPARRAMGTYIDNVKIRYNMPGNYNLLRDFSVQDAETDISGNTVTVSLPLYDADGNSLAIGTKETTASSINGDVILHTSADDTTGIVIGENTPVDYSAVGAGAYITCLDDNYKLVINRQFKEDFDTNSLFEGSSVATVERTLDGTFAAKGSFGANVSTSVSSAFDSAYIPDNNIGIHHTSEAHKKDSSTEIIDANNTNASGNALRIQKNTSYKENNTQKDTGNIVLVLNNFDGLENATTVTAEYDVAYEFNFTEIDGRTAMIPLGFCAGFEARNGNKGVWYNRIHLADGADGRFISSCQLWNNTSQALQEKSFTSDVNADDKWHHIKLEITRDSADVTNAYAYKLYIDGIETDSNKLTNINWVDRFAFLTSTRRSTGLWIDNINIEYNVN